MTEDRNANRQVLDHLLRDEAHLQRKCREVRFAQICPDLIAFGWAIILHLAEVNKLSFFLVVVDGTHHCHSNDCNQTCNTVCPVN